MSFDEYQKLASRTDFGRDERSWNSPKNFEKLLGLAGESGEVLEKFKKIFRDKMAKFPTMIAMKSSKNWATCCGMSR